MVTLLAKSDQKGVLSADGRFVAFTSKAQDLIPGQVDPNGSDPDVFLYDKVSGATTLVSRGAGPATTGNRISGGPSISADGNTITFWSVATDLIPGFIPQAPPPGSNSVPANVYRYHRTTGAMDLISRAPDSPLRSGSTSSFGAIPSADGRYVAFESESLRPVASGQSPGEDVYLYGPGGSTTGPTPLTPCTLLDTRRRTDRPVLTSDVRRAFPVLGRCGVPAAAKRVVVKVTVFNPSGKGNLRFYPGTATAAPSGILRFERGATRTESFTLPLGTNGALTILPFVAGKGTVHAAVEVSGYLE